MKRIYALLALIICLHAIKAQTTFTIMDSLIYHDGYAGLVKATKLPAGVIKHRNDLFARKLTKSELNKIGTKLQMDVTISALCDNYDRLGYVNMALVPIGDSTYVLNKVQRIELARFITPFMNKNVSPKSVPYTFFVDNVSALLKDTSITNKFDIWIELEVFGVPYAANTQVAGCSGRNDVFIGKLQFTTNAPTTVNNNNVLLPLFFKNNFNNYQKGATDSIGFTIKTLQFNNPTNLADAAFFLITSNHGANTNGEEYNRREHFVYFNNNEILTYTPGRTTCEPFRKYNTQGNGIYGPSARTPSQWQSFSNWCPGDVIDIRRIELGALIAGTHTFNISVPSALFNEGQGDIPLSLYLHGTKTGKLLNTKAVVKQLPTFKVYPNPSAGEFNIELETPNATIVITNLLGKEIYNAMVNTNYTTIKIPEKGLMFVTVSTNINKTTQKIVVN